jgi:hypothetical protein
LEIWQDRKERDKRKLIDRKTKKESDQEKEKYKGHRQSLIETESKVNERSMASIRKRQT